MGNGNNQNGNHNTNGHHPNGRVNLNGNGQNGHHGGSGVAEITGHDLLWDGLPPAVVSALEQPLDPALVSRRDGRGNSQLRVHRGPHRHRRSQPDLRLRRLGLRTGGRREPAPHREGGREDRGDQGQLRLQRAGARQRGGRSAPHRHRVSHRHRRQPGGPRDRRQGSCHRRAETGVAQLRRPVRKRSLRRAARCKLQRKGRRAGAPTPGAMATATPTTARATAAMPGGTAATSSSCGGGSSTWERSRATTRAGCGSWCKKQKGRDLDDLPAKDLKPLMERGGQARSTRRRPPRAATATGKTSGPTTIRRGRLQYAGRPSFSFTGTRRNKTMTATELMHTPWGWAQDIEELAEGVWRVSTAGHGGLKLSRERWYSLPDVVRDTFLNPDALRRRTARNPSPGRCWAWATPGSGNWH